MNVEVSQHLASRYLCLADFESDARRRLPWSIFGFIEGGSEDGQSLRANRAAFEAVEFVPRALVNTSGRTPEAQTLGRRWDAPFGVSPMGAIGVAAFEADLALARAAASRNVPFILSSSSLVPMERVIEANPHTWFQAYLSRDRKDDMPYLDRIAGNGFETLVITVDVPVGGNREENVRRGYSSPLRPNARMVMDSLCHPRWLAGTFGRSVLSRGMPHFENMPAERFPMFSLSARRTQGRDNLDWSDLSRLRDAWKKRLVVKGLLAPQDAERAARCGLDGIVVSNHGGRQLDGATAPLSALPDMVRAAGAMPVLLDGGIRRGTDVLKALALGASHVFLGRPMLYATVAAGASGAARAMDILKTEIVRDMALLGVRNLGELDASIVRTRARNLSAP